jgi:hypothetical protein
LGDLQGLSDGAERFNGNVGLDRAAFASLLPIGTSALGYVEVSDFDLPSRRCILTRNEPRERALPYTTLLGDQAN